MAANSPKVSPGVTSACPTRWAVRYGACLSLGFAFYWFAIQCDCKIWGPKGATFVHRNLAQIWPQKAALLSVILIYVRFEFCLPQQWHIGAKYFASRGTDGCAICFPGKSSRLQDFHINIAPSLHVHRLFSVWFFSTSWDDRCLLKKSMCVRLRSNVWCSFFPSPSLQDDTSVPLVPRHGRMCAHWATAPLEHWWNDGSF